MSTIPQTREPKQSKIAITVARDICAVLALGVLLLCVHELASPFIRGFYCNDESIRYPHKESTVPSSVCYFFGSGINILLVLILEYRNLTTNRVQNPRESQDEFPTMLYAKNVYCRLLVWLFGAISSELITDISKVTAGRLRPHFIDVCRPIVQVDRVDLSLDDFCRQDSNRLQYITNYYCSGIQSRLRDTRLSFMSGHSSYSSYSAAHAVFYLQSAMDLSEFGLIRSTLQVLLASAAFYTGLTRVSDYKHHWQDVLAGLTQGTLVAVVVSCCLWPAFNKVYSRFLKGSAKRAEVQNSGEELNPVSY